MIPIRHDELAELRAEGLADGLGSAMVKIIGLRAEGSPIFRQEILTV